MFRLNTVLSRIRGPSHASPGAGASSCTLERGDARLHLRVRMSRSVELIVDGYVKLNDRGALEALLAHRQALLRQLHGVTGIDPKQAIAQVSQEIAVIERVLAEFARSQADRRFECRSSEPASALERTPAARR